MLDRATMPCPTDDTLGALVHHTLERDAAAEVTAHVDDCVVCQQVVIAFVRSSDPAPSPIASGRRAPPSASRLGRYELRALLGAGGMGAVYEARDTELDRAVALKVLRPELSETPGLAERLVRESRLMARVAHPAVNTVYDVGREGGVVFIAMELVRGATLAGYLAANAHGWRAIVSLFERAGQGLAAAHGAGIVHRDFKPDNVLVAVDAHKVVVTDFGIAREAERIGRLDTQPGDEPAQVRDDEPVTRHGAVLGTPAYMAPEQLRGRPVDHRADVFAFSVSLWEALFGARPFPGRTAAAILAAMRQPPVRPPAGGRRVPRRLVRALERGLAIDPALRWPEMPALLAELAAVRAHPTRVWVGAVALGLVGVGIAAALAVTRPAAPIDRCAPRLAALDEAYRPALAAGIDAALVREPQIQRAVHDKLGAIAGAWRATQTATCHADREVVQDPTTTACLDARRIELAAAVDDLITNGPDGARHAIQITELPGAPAACATPAPGLLFARVPADRALRREVTALRARLADAEDARLRAEFDRGLEAATQVAADAAVWPPLQAEALFALGKLQSVGGDTKLAVATLRDAAVTAERAHHDEIAARSWTELAYIVGTDEGDPTRALEYATYAEAAADQIARPPSVMTQLEVVRGRALLAVNRSAEGEAAIRKAVAIARTTSPDDLAIALPGLGFLHEMQGHYSEAVEAYQQAIEHLHRSSTGQLVGPPRLFDRLAISLALIGKPVQAEIEARRAVEIADRTLPETQLDRPTAHYQLAWTLQNIDRGAEALVEIMRAVDGIARIQGTRSMRYGNALSLQGEIFSELGRDAEAAPMHARACEIVAFAVGEAASEYGSCEVRHATSLSRLHRNAEALIKVDRALVAISRTHGASHPAVGYALTVRGTAHAALGHHRQAIADFERAIAIFQSVEFEPSYLASAKWRLGKELWTAQPRRARAEITQALALFDRAAAPESNGRSEAAAWLAAHDPPERKPPSARRAPTTTHAVSEPAR